MKKIFRTATSQLEMILDDKRLCIIILLVFFIQQQTTSGLCEEARLVDGKINILEPFIAVTGTMWLQIIIPVIYLFLMHDFPSRYGGRIFYLIRTGRYGWLYAQIIFSIISSFIYVVSVFAISVVLSLDYITIDGNWSDVIVHYGTAMTNYAVYIKPSTFYQGHIVDVFLYEFVFMLLNLILINMIQLCSFSFNMRKPALFICLGLETIGAVLAFVSEKIRWIFPTANTIFSLHYENYISAPKYPIYMSAVYFVVLIMVLYITCFIGISKSRLADKVEG